MGRQLRRSESGMPLRRRLLLSLAAGVVPLLIVAAVTSLLVRTVSSDFRSARQRAAAAAQIAEIQAQITESGTAITSALTTSGGETVSAYLTATRGMAGMFKQLAVDVPAVAHGAVLRAAAGWETVRSDLTLLVRGLEQKPDSGGASVLPIVIRIGDEVVPPEHELETAAKSTAVSLTADLKRSHGNQQVQQNVLLLLALLGLLLVGWLSHRLNRLIGRPIANLKKAVEQLDPDSVERVELPRTPELSALASSFNDMADRLAVSTRVIAQNEARLHALFTNASDLVLVVGPDTTILSATPSAQHVLGISPDELQDRRFLDLVPETDHPVLLAALAGATSHDRVEFRLTHADGHQIVTETHIVDLTGEPAVRGIVLTIRDVTARKELENLLSHQAFHDTLTGLPNRALLRDRLGHALTRRTDGRPLAVLFIDLDDFKTVNDSLGHSAGDELLQIVAARLELHLRASDTAARLGGDEFVILLEDTDETEALATAARIRHTLNEAAVMAGIDVYPQGSIGVAIATPDTESADDLLAHADAAMYLAKTQDRGGICLYDQHLSGSVLRRLELKAELQRAVERAEIEVHYQPIFDLASRQLVGVEALARWQHPTLGRIMPNDFIPLAEQTGLIVDIGHNVLDQACRQFTAWQHQYGPQAPAFLTVNVSGRQLREPALIGQIAEVLNSTQLHPEQLVLEITESVMFSDDQPALARLDELKQLGVKLAIDDFGTGYSSLAYLQRLPVDILKLDKNFVDELQTGKPSAKAVAKAIIDLGHQLGLRIIAEGIETQGQADLLQSEICDYGQGYLLDRPLTASQITQRLSQTAPASIRG